MARKRKCPNCGKYSLVIECQNYPSCGEGKYYKCKHCGQSFGLNKKKL